MFIKCLLLLLAASLLSAGLVPAPENRIIGGANIKIEEAPWQVFLTVKGKPQCGGSIYSKDIIITAAHCLSNDRNILFKARDFRVFVGSELWRSCNTKSVKVAAIKPHEKFSRTSESYANDIGIMKLAEPLKFTTKIQPIALAKRAPASGSKAWSTGWGLVQYYSIFGIAFLKVPEVLQGIQVPIQDFNLCKRSLPWVTQDTICAGGRGGTTCSGDSGGPLVLNKELVGVVSSGAIDCGSAGVYASVAYFRHWLLSSIKAI